MNKKRAINNKVLTLLVLILLLNPVIYAQPENTESDKNKKTETSKSTDEKPEEKPEDKALKEKIKAELKKPKSEIDLTKISTKILAEVAKEDKTLMKKLIKEIERRAKESTEEALTIIRANEKGWVEERIGVEYQSGSVDKYEIKDGKIIITFKRSSGKIGAVLVGIDELKAKGLLKNAKVVDGVIELELEKPPGVVEKEKKTIIKVDGTSLEVKGNELVIGNGMRIVVDRSIEQTLTFTEKGISCSETSSCSIALDGQLAKIEKSGSINLEGNILHVNKARVEGKTERGTFIAQGDVRIPTVKECTNNVCNRFLDVDKLSTLARVTHPDGSQTQSRLTINDKRFREKIDIATGIGEKPVYVCLNRETCGNFNPHNPSISGAVVLDLVRNSQCTAAACQKVHQATMVGKVITRFNGDAYYQGTQRNLVTTYKPEGKNDKGTPEAVFKIRSCVDCEKGIVGHVTLNKQSFKLDNQPHSNDHSDLLIHFKKTTERTSLIHYASFNEDGFQPTVDQMYTDDVLNPHKIAGYLLKKGYTYEQIPDIIVSRNLYVVDETAFNFDGTGSKANKISVKNLYASLVTGVTVIDQRSVVDQGIYAQFFYDQAQTEIVDLLDQRGLTGDQRQTEFEKLQKSAAHRAFLQEQLQKASALINIQREKGIWTVGRITQDRAEQLLRSYNEKHEGMQLIFKEQASGKSLVQIYDEMQASGSSQEIQEIKAAFKEPLLRLSLGEELIALARTEYEQPDKTIARQWLISAEGQEVKKTVEIINPITGKKESIDLENDPLRKISLDAAKAYTKEREDGFYDPKLATQIWGGYLTKKLASDKHGISLDEQFAVTAQLQRAIDTEISVGALLRIIDISRLDPAYRNLFYDLEDQDYMTVTPEIRSLIDRGILSVDDVLEFGTLNAERASNERSTNFRNFIDENVIDPIAMVTNLALELRALKATAVGIKYVDNILDVTKTAAKLTGKSFSSALGLGAGSIDNIPLYYKTNPTKGEYEALTRLHKIEPGSVARPISVDGTGFAYYREKVPGLTLKEFLEGGGKVTGEMRAELTKTFQKFWEKGVTHGAISPETIVITPDFKFKIIDPVGVPKVSTHQVKAPEHVGIPVTSTPEVKTPNLVGVPKGQSVEEAIKLDKASFGRMFQYVERVGGDHPQWSAQTVKWINDPKTGELTVKRIVPEGLTPKRFKDLQRDVIAQLDDLPLNYEPTNVRVVGSSVTGRSSKDKVRFLDSKRDYDISVVVDEAEFNRFAELVREELKKKEIQYPKARWKRDLKKLNRYIEKGHLNQFHINRILLSQEIYFEGNMYDLGALYGVKKIQVSIIREGSGFDTPVNIAFD